jgi:hypothetical protein
MNNWSLRIFMVILAVFFLSSCAVWVRDDHHHRRGRHHWRSSLQQSEAQMTAQNSGDSGSYEQVIR